jgi:hypothetical protein
MHLSCRLSCKLCTRPETRYSAGTSGLAAELARVAPSVPGHRPPGPHGPPPPPAPASAGYVVEMGEADEDGAGDAAVAPDDPVAVEAGLTAPRGKTPLSYVSMRKREKRRLEHRWALGASSLLVVYWALGMIQGPVVAGHKPAWQTPRHLHPD